MTQTRYRASLDYLTVTIDGTGSSPAITDASVQLCFSRSIGVPDNPVWYGTTNNNDGTVTILEGPNSPAVVTTLTAGCWFIMVKVIDNPSIPIFFGGTFYVLD